MTVVDLRTATTYSSPPVRTVGGCRWTGTRWIARGLRLLRRDLGMLGRPLVTVSAERLRGPLGEYVPVARRP